MGAKDARRCQKQAAQETEKDGGVDSLTQALLLPGSVEAGRQNIGAHGQANKQIG